MLGRRLQRSLSGYRQALLIMLIVACGCGPGEVPKKAPEADRAAATASPRPSGAAGPASSGPAPRSAAPTPSMPRVAILVFGSRGVATATAPIAAVTLFRQRMTELGYVDGRNIAFEEHYADGDLERLARLAREIVDRKPDLIVTIPAAATLAARRATATIPIVMAHAGDPGRAGLVASLQQPGGNVTGTTSLAPELGAKQVELLRQLLPGLVRLGVLANPTNMGAPQFLANVEEAAHKVGITVTIAEATRAEDFDTAFSTLLATKPDALLVMIEPMIFLNRERVLNFARSNRLPTSFDVGRELVRQGGLISYGPVLMTHYARVAEYVDKILKGAKPGDLPIQQPTEFALAINLQTAQELGLTIPPSLLARADELIK